VSAMADTTRIPISVPTWYGVVGGPVAWAIHLGTAWSVVELSCLAPSSSGVLLHGGSLGSGSRLAVWLGTGVPWLVALSAVAACVLATVWHRRARRARSEVATSTERVSLLLVLGWFLSLMSLAAITGGAIALAVLEPCG
jgi:hypothetical protein